MSYNEAYPVGGDEQQHWPAGYLPPGTQSGLPAALVKHKNYLCPRHPSFKTRDQRIFFYEEQNTGMFYCESVKMYRYRTAGTRYRYRYLLIFKNHFDKHKNNSKIARYPESGHTGYPATRLAGYPNGRISDNITIRCIRKNSRIPVAAWWQQTGWPKWFFKRRLYSRDLNCNCALEPALLYSIRDMPENNTRNF